LFSDKHLWAVRDIDAVLVPSIGILRSYAVPKFFILCTGVDGEGGVTPKKFLTVESTLAYLFITLY